MMNKREYIQETERLVIRKLANDDFDTLLTIMGKPEVMYAWEHGFNKDDVRAWIERQLMRYAKDGVGYFAVELKESGLLVGQAGLMKTIMNGNEVVEIGYIFDNTYWHNGYATEAPNLSLPMLLTDWNYRLYIAASVRKTRLPSEWQNGLAWNLVVVIPSFTEGKKCRISYTN